MQAARLTNALLLGVAGLGLVGGAIAWFAGAPNQAAAPPTRPSAATASNSVFVSRADCIGLSSPTDRQWNIDCRAGASRRCGSRQVEGGAKAAEA